MRRVVFLSLREVLTIHQRMLAEAGGQDGILKQDGLESAIASPQATYAKQHLNAFPFEMAAAYLIGFCQNHAFVDGNKRVAAVAAIVFLRLNGFRLAMPSPDLADMVLAVARGEMKKSAVAQLLERSSQRSRGR